MRKQHHRNALNPFLNGTKTATLTVRVNDSLPSPAFLRDVLLPTVDGNIDVMVTLGVNRPLTHIR